MRAAYDSGTNVLTAAAATMPIANHGSTLRLSEPNRDSPSTSSCTALPAPRHRRLRQARLLGQAQAEVKQHWHALIDNSVEDPVALLRVAKIRRSASR
jgi:hypothetical protein